MSSKAAKERLALLRLWFTCGDPMVLDAKKESFCWLFDSRAFLAKLLDDRFDANAVKPHLGPHAQCLVAIADAVQQAAAQQQEPKAIVEQALMTMMERYVRAECRRRAEEALRNSKTLDKDPKGKLRAALLYYVLAGEEGTASRVAEAAGLRQLAMVLLTRARARECRDNSPLRAFHMFQLALEAFENKRADERTLEHFVKEWDVGDKQESSIFFETVVYLVMLPQLALGESPGSVAARSLLELILQPPDKQLDTVKTISDMVGATLTYALVLAIAAARPEAVHLHTLLRAAQLFVEEHHEWRAAVFAYTQARQEQLGQRVVALDEEAAREAYDAAVALGEERGRADGAFSRVEVPHGWAKHRAMVEAQHAMLQRLCSDVLTKRNEQQLVRVLEAVVGTAEKTGTTLSPAFEAVRLYAVVQTRSMARGEESTEELCRLCECALAWRPRTRDEEVAREHVCDCAARRVQRWVLVAPLCDVKRRAKQVHGWLDGMPLTTQLKRQVLAAIEKCQQQRDEYDDEDDVDVDAGDGDNDDSEQEEAAAVAAAAACWWGVGQRKQKTRKPKAAQRM